VAGGVFFEIMFGRWALHQGSELQQRTETALAEANERAGRAVRRAGEASERAAALEKEAAEARERTAKLEVLTAWRHISPKHRDEIVEQLRPVGSSLRLFFEYQNGDQEAYSYAGEIAEMFLNAGVAPGIIGIRHQPNLWMVGGLFGASISVSPDINGSAVVTPLIGAGIVSLVNPWDALRMWPIPQDQLRPNVLICVYPKPLPAFPAPADEKATNSANDDRTAALEKAVAHATGRQIPPEQRESLVSALRTKIPLNLDQISHGKIRRNDGEKILIDVVIEHQRDAEAESFARAIESIFVTANAARVSC
jgi:uncharacterized membrane protein